MSNALIIAKKLWIISLIYSLFIIAVYWFDLDELFIKSVEPGFRKLSAWVKAKELEKQA